MIKVLLLDADGVLINGKRFSHYLEHDLGITTAKTTPFFTGPFLECLTGKTDLKETIQPYLTEWGWSKSVEEFLDYWFQAEHTLDEAFIEYIQKLRKSGTKTYVATNQEKYRAEYMLEKMGFAQAFDGLFASAHLGQAKPDTAFYVSVMQKLPGIEKDEVLFWDDTLSNVVAAKEYGLEAELYESFEGFLEGMRGYGFRIG